MARLQAVNSELLKDKEEALPLLDAYRSAYNYVCLLLSFCFTSCVALCHELKFNSYISKGMYSLQRFYLLLV